MQTRRILRAAALGVMLGALPASEAAAQSAPDQGLGSLQTLYTQLRFDGDGDAARTRGVSARLMWRPVDAPADASSLAARTSVGFYGAVMPKRDFTDRARFAILELGGMAQVRPLASPLAERVDPFLALGAGVLHTDLTLPVRDATSPLLASSGVSFTLSPSVGASVRVMPHLALQGELRDVVTFRGGTRHNLALGAGLGFTF